MKRRTLSALPLLVLAALLLMLLGRKTTPQPRTQHTPSPISESLLADERNTIEVFRRATHSVVFITS